MAQSNNTASNAHPPNNSSKANNTAAGDNQHHNADDFVDAITAAMPPSMEAKRTKTADEILAELNRIPLFMTTLDETDGEGGENVMLEAIKALAYEGTKAEVAANFREQGNEAARAKLWKDAREFYTKAIASVQGKVKLSEARPPEASRITDVTEGEEPAIQVTELDHEVEAIKEREIEEACLANRALCNLEMKNYGQVNKDCASVLRINPHNIKAWYRAAAACLALDKIPEAEDACTSGLSFDASNSALTSLKTKIQNRKDYLAGLEQERQQREQRQRIEEVALRGALKARNIATRETTVPPPEMEDAAIQLEDPQDPASTLTFPVLFLYPLHAQTDFVKAFQENEALTDHLSYLLPVPWDEADEYAVPDVECYMETSQGGLIKAGKKLSLIKLLGSGKVEIVDGLVRIYIVPKKRSAEWITEFKTRKGKQ